jgi:hypothetical protein
MCHLFKYLELGPNVNKQWTLGNVGFNEEQVNIGLSKMTQHDMPYIFQYPAGTRVWQAECPLTAETMS